MQAIHPGDHIFVKGWFYSHHGIYVGNGEVIHFDSSVKTKFSARIRRANLSLFGGGGKVRAVKYRNCDPADVVIARAETLLQGAAGVRYDLLLNNCEHFATYCKTGSPNSEQVREASATGIAVAALPFVGGIGAVGVVSITAATLPVIVIGGLAGVALGYAGARYLGFTFEGDYS